MLIRGLDVICKTWAESRCPSVEWTNKPWHVQHKLTQYKGYELCSAKERQDHLKCALMGEKLKVKRLSIVCKILVIQLSETSEAKEAVKDQRLQQLKKKKNTKYFRAVK